MKKNTLFLTKFLFSAFCLAFIGIEQASSSLKEQEKDSTSSYNRVVASEARFLPEFGSKESLKRMLKKIDTGKHRAPQKLLKYVLDAQKRGVLLGRVPNLSTFILQVHTQKKIASKIVASEAAFLPEIANLKKTLSKISKEKYRVPPQKLLEYIVGAQKRGVPLEYFHDISDFILRVHAQKKSVLRAISKKKGDSKKKDGS